jgi:hypothetical protein
MGTQQIDHAITRARRNTIGDAVRRSAARGPEKVALIFGERRWSYAELDAGANRVANALLAQGLEKGDRVAAYGVGPCSWSAGTLWTAARATKTAERNGERDTDRRESLVGRDRSAHSFPLVSPRPDSSHASAVSILSPRRNAARAITKDEMGVVTSRNTPMRIAL